MKLLKCGMACCVFLSIVAWQTKDTSLQPTDAKGFIVEIQKKYAEIQAIKQKGNQEETENKIKAVHRRLTRAYPVYYDWWLQDGTTGDVDWFNKSFNQELSVRLQKLNIKAAVTNAPESIESAFLSYLKACEQRRIKRLEAFTADKPEIVSSFSISCCCSLSSSSFFLSTIPNWASRFSLTASASAFLR